MHTQTQTQQVEAFGMGKTADSNEAKKDKDLGYRATLKTWLRTLSMVFALVLIWAIFQYVTDGAFLQPRNLSNLFRQMTVTGVLAIGMMFIIVAGHIDLSVGSVVAFLGAIIAIVHGVHGFGAGTTLLLALGVGLLIAAVYGYLVSYQKVPAFIVTLGGMMIFRGASMWITAGNTIPLPDSWLLSLGTAYIPSTMAWGIFALGAAMHMTLAWRDRQACRKYGLPVANGVIVLAKVLAPLVLVGAFMAILASYEGVPVPVLILAILTLFGHFVATKTVFGRQVYAIGGNVEAAHLSGVNVKARTFGIFLLMGTLATVAGVILTARVGSASPDAGQLLELDAIASCVIGGTSLMGGKGTIFGAILGALVMESLNNGMSMANMDSFWQYIVKGLVLVAAVWLDVTSQKQKA